MRLAVTALLSLACVAALYGGDHQQGSDRQAYLVASLPYKLTYLSPVAVSNGGGIVVFRDPSLRSAVLVAKRADIGYEVRRIALDIEGFNQLRLSENGKHLIVTSISTCVGNAEPSASLFRIDVSSGAVEQLKTKASNMEYLAVIANRGYCAAYGVITRKIEVWESDATAPSRIIDSPGVVHVLEWGSDSRHLVAVGSTRWLDRERPTSVVLFKPQESKVPQWVARLPQEFHESYRSFVGYCSGTNEVRYLRRLPDRQGFGDVRRYRNGEFVGQVLSSSDWRADNSQMKTSVELDRFALLHDSTIKWYSYDRPERHYAEVRVPYRNALLMAASPDGRTVVTIDPEREVSVWNDGMD